MKWNFHRTVFCAVLLACCLPCLSKNSYSAQNPWFVTGGIGKQYPDVHSVMTVDNGSDAPVPYNHDLYSTKSGNPITVVLAAGKRFERASTWLPAYSLGVSYQHLFSSNVGGMITQYSAPEFQNYSYDWDISSDVFLATAKINLFQTHHVSPYLSGGIGCAFNRASDYSETALPDVDARISPGFTSNTASQLAYSVGAGVDVVLTEKIIISAEYQYQNLGNVASAKGANSWSSQTLNLGSYHTRTVFLTASYLIGN